MEIPRSWTELSDAALGYVCELLAMESYTVLELCAYVLRWVMVRSVGMSVGRVR